MYQFPPDVNININVTRLYYSEEYWSLDAAEFRLQRWDGRNQEGFLARNRDLPGQNGLGFESSDIHRPLWGVYIPSNGEGRAF